MFFAFCKNHRFAGIELVTIPGFLQRLYKLYNDVIDSVNNYHNIPWAEVNIEDINNELLEFQNRCRKLPKALKEWPAFHALKKTIDDFNDICPLLELMSNKAMKYRHWQKIQSITGFTFDLERPGFCLKDILEAPLLPNKEDIEDVCISALKEKDIEAKLRQVTVSQDLEFWCNTMLFDYKFLKFHANDYYLQSEWSTQELSFMVFKNRGELLLRGDTTAETGEKMLFAFCFGKLESTDYFHIHLHNSQSS